MLQRTQFLSPWLDIIKNWMMDSQDLRYIKFLNNNSNTKWQKNSLNKYWFIGEWLVILKN